MRADRFDALVVGSGPGGSVAALVLARGGARVALVDKATFPRDKACGDLIGPRGLRLLEELGLGEPSAPRVGDMVLVGPTGRSATLPCFPGATYPDHGVAVPRSRFDATLFDAAVAAGAEPVTGRAAEALFSDGSLEGFALSTGRALRADAVIGADGALSRVAAAAGLVDTSRTLWGFAVSVYVDEPIVLPHIVLWEPAPWRIFPGYGWLFPGANGRSNVGLGLGLLADRSRSVGVTRAFAGFVDHLVRIGLLGSPLPARDGLRGGWLKMGSIGTIPARERVLLVGDAAGLINPLQGEGISQAMESGRAAAQAVLADPATAEVRYRGSLARSFSDYQSVAAAVQAVALRRPAFASVLGRALTVPGLPEAIRGGWALYWNDLVDGAFPTPARRVASSFHRVGRSFTRGGPTRRWFDRELPSDAVLAGVSSGVR